MAMGFSVSELCSLDLDTGMYETIMTVPAKSYDYQSMTMDHSTGHIYIFGNMESVQPAFQD